MSHCHNTRGSLHTVGLRTAVCLLLLLLSAGTVVGFSTPDHVYRLAPALSLGWLFQGNEVNLIIEKTRPGHAFVGVGKSIGTADIVLIETVGNALTVRDCYTEGDGAPICTESQDWTTVESTISASGFKVEVKRFVRTGDARDTEIILSYNSIAFGYSDSPTVLQRSDMYGSEAADSSGSRGSGVTILHFLWGVKEEAQYILGNGTFMRHEHTQLIIWGPVCDGLIICGR